MDGLDESQLDNKDSFIHVKMQIFFRRKHFLAFQSITTSSLAV
jgi:hypothetical protein